MFDPYDDAEYHATKLKPSHPPNLVDLRDGGRQKRKHDFEEEQRTKSVKLATVRTDKQIPIKQTVSFITKPSEIMPELWRSLKKLQKQVCLKDDLSRFGNKSLNLKLLDSKVKVMAMDQEVVARARRLANPYERIGNSIFINR